jgi:chaperonin GroES
MKGVRMSFKPLGDRVLVNPLAKEEMSKGGIVLPDTVKEKPQEGKVIAVGVGKFDDGTLVPMEVKVGQTVMFSKYGPTEIKVDGEEMYVLSESDILGVIE